MGFEDRKVRKPLMEKKRRARINSSLDTLKKILLLNDPYVANKIVPKVSKLEKADVLELTVNFLRRMLSMHRRIYLPQFPQIMSPFRMSGNVMRRPRDRQQLLPPNLGGPSPEDSYGMCQPSPNSVPMDTSPSNHHYAILSPPSSSDGDLEAQYRNSEREEENSVDVTLNGDSDHVWRPWMNVS
ncbi:enhancer of split mgamma protein-like [Euwallacea fornicatus]|uniref:enhancer of split mgamma protein-like n=1 Tax=Euwallacea fornicatus TaxID=995702 RepID=UPI00338DF6FE